MKTIQEITAAFRDEALTRGNKNANGRVSLGDEIQLADMQVTEVLNETLMDIAAKLQMLCDIARKGII